MKIPLAKPVFDKEMEHAAVDALRNEHFVMGESVYKFEEEFAKFCGTKYGVSTASGTSALQLSLLALGLNGGDEVITTPYSFIATANVTLHVNSLPVFADVDLMTRNLDPRSVKARVTSRTKAIMPVHLYGYPAEMDAIMDIAKDRGLAVVEDACQAHGAEYHGRRAGSIGDVGCFSFYPSKNMTVCGDGGMLVTNNEEVAKKVAKLRDCGRVSHYEHDMIGFTSRLNTVSAAIGRVQLRRVEEWNRMRRRRAAWYKHLLDDIGEIIVPPGESSSVKPVFHLYVIRSIERNRLKTWLEENGVQCGIHYPIPIHLQPIYESMYGYQGGHYPNTELLSKTVLSIPMFPDLTKEEIEYVCEKIGEFVTHKTASSPDREVELVG